MRTFAKYSTVKIGTRSSALALWQAKQLKRYFDQSDIPSELVTIESTGDLDLNSPLYKMGITGVFTRELDAALLMGKIDVAVHSLKDVPTQLAKGLVLSATLERGSYEDVMMIKDGKNMADSDFGLATSSIRRRAQWLAKYPNHKMLGIRGNVQTRMTKFYDNDDMSAVIFAKAGLERMNLLPDDAVVLDWMIPAPAQGIVGITCRTDDQAMQERLNKVNHQPTFLRAKIERDFMRTLMGGCSVPISAFADVVGDQIHFTGAMHDIDGSQFNIVKLNTTINTSKDLGKQAAQELLKQNGAGALLEKIRNTQA